MFKRFFLSERSIMIAILLNAMVIFLLYFPEFSQHFLLEWIDHFFVILFMLEAIVKIIVWTPKIYFSSRWNWFDFIVVIASMPSLLLTFIEIPDTSLLLVLRLFRLIRLVRFIGFIPNLSNIMAGLGRALQASIFVLLALFFLNFMLGIFTCHFYGKMAPQYFGNPLISCYSIFQMFTIEGWNEIPAYLAKRMDSDIWIGIMRFYFVVVVLCGGIFGMSLANAIFVDEMTMDNTRLLEKKIDDLQTEVSELKKLLVEQLKNKSEDVENQSEHS